MTLWRKLVFIMWQYSSLFNFDIDWACVQGMPRSRSSSLISCICQVIFKWAGYYRYRQICWPNINRFKWSQLEYRWLIWRNSLSDSVLTKTSVTWAKIFISRNIKATFSLSWNIFFFILYKNLNIKFKAVLQKKKINWKLPNVCSLQSWK